MKKKKIIIPIILLLVVIAVFITYKKISALINAPSKGTVSEGKSIQAVKNTFSLTPKTASGKYATFNYPQELEVTANSKLASPFLAMYNFEYHDIETWNLAIDILSVPGGSLNDNNSYQYRKLNPSTYQESHQVINGHSVDIMTDKTVGGFSEVAFLVNGPYQATVSLYGDDPTGTGNLKATFNMILSSWHWLAG